MASQPRRRFLRTALSLSPVPLIAAQRGLASQGPPSGGAETSGDAEAEAEAAGLTWHDAESWGIEGRGWASSQMERYYGRLPAKAKPIVREAVWNLSQHSSGMVATFDTDATTIHVRYTLSDSRLAMPHMPATGVSGIDLYALDAEAQPRWVAVNRPSTAPEVSGPLVENLDPGKRRFVAYLPLYNGVEKLEFGVAEGSEFTGVAPRTAKPMVFYGTSITHGACASRPGMTHPAILGRRLGLPIVNLGFSGNGRMEIDVATLMTEIDAAVYVVDCLPNITAEVVAANTGKVVNKLRSVRPDTPIVLVEDRTYGYAWIRQSARERHRDSRAALVRAYDQLIESGVRDLYYLPGAELLGDDDEATTDGSHPNDLGFMRQADAFEPVLRSALGLAEAP